jgi:GT2 family glycosyltransferase
MNPAERPAGAVAIVTYNAEGQIRACLDSLAPCRGRWQVAVADNGSTDGTLAILAEYPWVQVVALGKNEGFAHGCNAAARATTAEWVLFLNPDTVVPPGATDELLARAASSGARAAAPRLNNPDGSYQAGSANRRLPTFGYLLCEALLVHRMWPGNPFKRSNQLPGFDPSRSGRIEQPLGAALLIRRDLYEALGGWDERFAPIWFEDIDLAARMNARSEPVIYSADVTVTHTGQHTLSLFSKTHALAVWNANLTRYIAKHSGPRKASIIRIAATFGVCARGMIHLLRPGAFREGLAHFRLAMRMLGNAPLESWYRR